VFTLWGAITFDLSTSLFIKHHEPGSDNLTRSDHWPKQLAAWPRRSNDTVVSVKKIEKVTFFVWHLTARSVTILSMNGWRRLPVAMFNELSSTCFQSDEFVRFIERRCSQFDLSCQPASVWRPAFLADREIDEVIGIFPR
jgi:hypothetical protein